MTGGRRSAWARPVAVVVARDGRLPVGADEAVAEAGGAAIVVGSGTEAAARSLAGADRAWWAETGAGPPARVPGRPPGSACSGRCRW